MELGNRLRDARHSAGLTQERVAFLSDIDYKRYQRIEAGEVNVTLRTLVRIAEAIGADLWRELLASADQDSIAEITSAGDRRKPVAAP
jgi:transcriptional regulator with XRE-family HTH domain